MKVTFQSHEQFLVYDLKRIEEILTKINSVDSVHLLAVFVGTLMLVIGWSEFKTVGVIGGLIVVIGIVSHLVLYFKKRPFMSRRDEIIEELFNLDYKKYGWMTFRRNLDAARGAFVGYSDMIDKRE